MAEYTYTKKLNLVRGEYHAYGVTVHSEANTVQCWWNVPRKYIGLVIGSHADDFIDFAAEVDMEGVSMVMDATGSRLRVFFWADIDLTQVDKEMKKEYAHLRGKMSCINNLHNSAINEAANRAVRIKNKYCDFIRYWFFKERLHYEAPQTAEFARAGYAEDIPF
jgi:hypothetical protein